MKTQQAMSIALVLASCSDGGHPPAPDMALPGGDLTIEIHRQFPFVDGDTADEATFVAVQDGDGPFAAVTGENGIYHAHVTNDRYGIAVGCRDAGVDSIEVIQQVIAEGTTYKTLCKSKPATATLELNVKNLPAGQKIRLRTLTTAATLANDGASSSSLAPGPTELFGAVFDTDRNVLGFVRKALDVKTTTSVTIDAAVDVVAAETGTLTLSPAEPTASVRTAILRPYGSITLQAGTGTLLGTSPKYFMMPASLRRSDDLYRVTVFGSTGNTTRIVKSAQPLAFTLPASLDAQPATLATTSALRPVWTFTPTAARLPIQSYFVDVDDVFTSSSTLHFWSSRLSTGWIAGASSVRYEFPDLSSMPGFANLALPARSRLDASIIRNESSAADAADGGESTSTSVQTTLGEFCGDGVVQAAAGEACDPDGIGESATCNDDCTVAKCGDGKINATAGEECDPPDDTTCSATCTNIVQ